MISLQTLAHTALDLFHSNLGRIALSGSFVWLTLWLLRVARRRTLNTAGTMTERRERYVWIRNTLVGTVCVTLLVLWGSSIAGVALSLAAVAGATLLVSKEFLANVLGHFYFLFTRPFTVGDFVEIAGARGRLTDVHVLALTLTETLEGNQLTGRTITIPSASLLTSPARNLTATGRYTIHILQVAVDPRADVLRCEDALMRAAVDVCAPWIEQATTHLESVENRRILDLPSAQPRVLMELRDGKTAYLNLRYVCETENRVNVEQEILRRYLRQGVHVPPKSGS